MVQLASLREFDNVLLVVEIMWPLQFSVVTTGEGQTHKTDKHIPQSSPMPLTRPLLSTGHCTEE